MSDASPRRRRRWTPDSIVEEIKLLSDRSAKSVQRSFPSLYGAAVRKFGSWKNAVSQAGFDYRSEAKRKIPGYWDRQNITESIKMLREKHSNYVRRNHGALYNAALRVFGSWEEAIRASGFEYGVIKKGLAKRRFD